MAEGKSPSKIFIHEKYMDDASSSIFANLRKAAKRKNDHIWSTNTFTFLDTVWGDETKPEMSNSRNDASNSKKDPKYENGPLKKQFDYCHTKLGTYIPEESEKKRPENESTRYHLQNLTNSLNSKTATVFNESGKDLKSISTVNKLESKNLIGINDISAATPSNAKEEDCDMMLSTLHQSMVKKEIPANDSNNECRIHDMNCEQNQPNSQGEKNVSGTNYDKIIRYISKLLFEIPKMPSDFKTSIHKSIDVSLHGKTHTSSSKPTSDNQEFPKKISRSEINGINLNQNSKTASRAKRTRHNSESSTKSSPRLTKKFPWKSENSSLEQHSEKRNSILKTMLSIKIMNCDKLFDLAVKLSELERIKKKFLKLEKIFPDIDGSRKEISYSVEAIKAVFGFLFNPPFNFNELPEDRITLELIAVAKAWGIANLEKRLQKKFIANISTKLTKNNFEIYTIALTFGMFEICEAYKNIFTGDESFTSDKPFRQKNCFLSVSTYIEPLEFCIPLHTAFDTMNDKFNRDISNEIIFKAIADSYVIMGFHIQLNVDEEELNSKNLRIFYSVKNLDNLNQKEEMKVSKPLRSTIVIHFQKYITLNRNQKAEIAVDISIEPYFCFAIPESGMDGKCEEDFSLNYTSTYKVSNSNEKRFFIGKLLYYSNSAKSQ